MSHEDDGYKPHPNQPAPPPRQHCMQIASGRVVGGRIELDGELPAGTLVTVIAREGDETFEADPATEKMLLDAIAQCDRGETIPMSQLLSELRSRE
jgi:hypothetical protein